MKTPKIQISVAPAKCIGEESFDINTLECFKTASVSLTVNLFRASIMFLLSGTEKSSTPIFSGLPGP